VARILIADDHEVVRDGLRMLLGRNPLWQVCAEAANGQQAVEKVRQTNPDLVILDVSMPVMNGLEAAVEIRRLAPKVRILIFSMHNSTELVEAARQAGVDAFVEKSSVSGELLGTLRRLLDT
jgi:DNA-binding NarL/FixJ family response regulator